MVNQDNRINFNNLPKSLIFIRHGENIIDSKISDNLLPLSDKGIKQALKAKERLNNNFDMIISSPSLRTCQTAEIIGDSKNYLIDSRLLEKGYGNKEQDGKETTLDVIQRLLCFFDDLKKYQDKRILIVTHGSLINLIKNILEEKNIRRNHIDNCYIYEYKNSYKE